MELVRGQRARLSDLTDKTRLKVDNDLEGPEPGDVSYLALLLGESGEAISPAACVSDDRQRSECGGVQL